MTKHIVALVVMLALAVPASAASLVSPAIWPTDGAKVGCTLLNVGKKPLRDVEIQILSGGGVAQGGGGYSSIEPGQAGGSSFSPGPSVVYCRFTFKGSRRAARGTVCAQGLGCVPAN